MDVVGCDTRQQCLTASLPYTLLLTYYRTTLTTLTARLPYHLTSALPCHQDGLRQHAANVPWLSPDRCLPCTMYHVPCICTLSCSFRPSRRSFHPVQVRHAPALDCGRELHRCGARGWGQVPCALATAPTHSIAIAILSMPVLATAGGRGGLGGALGHRFAAAWARVRAAFSDG